MSDIEWMPEIAAAGAHRMLGDRYRLRSVIGRGASSVVWRADDLLVGEAVALKRLLSASRPSRSTVARFRREVGVSQAVRHRNVVSLHTFGMDDGEPYLVMELLTGMTLEQRYLEGGMRARTFLALIAEALLGLDAIHRAGFIHRDLKPSNLFVADNPHGRARPKILDFGVCRVATGERASVVRSRSIKGFLVGTPAYMAPEQARGEVDLDARADLYSVGAMIFEGLTSRLPLGDGSAAEMLAKLADGARVPRLHTLDRRLPRALSQVVGKVLHPKREMRPSSARALRRALLSAAASVSAEATLPPPFRASTMRSLSMPIVGEPPGAKATPPSDGVPSRPAPKGWGSRPKGWARLRSALFGSARGR